MNIVLSIVAIVLSLAALVYTVKLTLVYHRFNEQIKDWAQSLDDDMAASIRRASHLILAEIDEKITENNKEKDTKEDE